MKYNERSKGSGVWQKGTRRMRGALLTLCFVLTVVAVSGLATGISAAKNEESHIISTGIYIIANENAMAMAGLKGGNISFEKNDFLRALNLEDVDSITVTKLPPVTDGVLLVGERALTSNETLSAASLSKLTYIPSGSITESSFSFKSPVGEYEIECMLYMLDELNYSPTLSGGNELSVNVSTYKNVKLFGNLSVSDPEGDETFIDIVSYPKSGIIELSSKKGGEYTFSPDKSFSGKDSFTYVARDKYGNYSAARTVSITVKRPSALIRFDDMVDTPEYSAAIAMAEEGIMDGTRVGAGCFFYPDRTVSRGEFVVMAMESLGMKCSGDSEAVVFADSGEMPEYMKPYMSEAYRLGIIKGVERDGRIYAEATREISKAEAAVIIANIVSPSMPTSLPVISDASDIPVWAEASVYSLCSEGIIPLDSEAGLSPNLSLTRGESAVILSNLITLYMP